LKAEISKSKMGIGSFNSAPSGKIPAMPGVVEIDYAELDIGS